MGAFLVVVKFLHYFAVKLRRKREIEEKCATNSEPENENPAFTQF
jgi:hypothetical protein